MTGTNKRDTFKYAFILAAFAVTLISCGTSPSSARALREPNARERVYMAHLREQGYAPGINQYGDFTFERGDFTYYLTISERNPDGNQLWIPVFFIDSADSASKAVYAASQINRQVLVARAYISPLANGEMFVIATDFYLKEPDNFRIILPQLLESFDEALKILDRAFGIE